MSNIVFSTFGSDNNSIGQIGETVNVNQVSFNEKDEGTLYSDGEILVSLNDGISIEDVINKYSFIERSSKSSISNYTNGTYCLKLKEGVGAINASHDWQTWSNGGPELDVVAPGYYIRSTVRKFDDGFTDDGYSALSGTSMATPYVAGVSALCMTKNPNLSFSQLYDCLTKTANDLGDVGRDDYYGYGQVVPSRAVQYASDLADGKNPDDKQDNDNENLKIYSIHKGGEDKDCFNILIAGDGYTKDQQGSFVQDAKLRTERLFNWEPYKQYKDKINIYGVNIVSNESDFNKDTYFSLYSSGGRVIDFKDSEHYNKARDLKLELEKQLNNEAGFGTVHILSNTTGYYGASRNSWFSFSTLSHDGTDSSVMAHEMAHSIGKLGDEYDKITKQYNVDYSTKTADTVKWKEFLGFRGVGLASGNASDGSIIIPPQHA